MNGESLAELRDAQARWEEFAAGDECPWFLECLLTLEPEDYVVPLARDTYKRGPQVVRRVILRMGSQEGRVVLDQRVPHLRQAVDVLTEGVQFHVGEYGDRPDWAWATWVHTRTGWPVAPVESWWW